MCGAAAFFYFSSSFFFVSFLLNIIFLYFPVLGAPKSSITGWLKDFRGRHWSLLAGVLCGLGNGFQFMVCYLNSFLQGGKLESCIQPICLTRKGVGATNAG